MANKRVILFLNGEIKNYAMIKKLIYSNDFLIGVDGGTKHILKLKLKPDLIIGDLDSYTPKNKKIPIIKYPTNKDFTDSELALQYILKNKFTEIIVFGFTGNRLDHMLSNLFLFASLPIKTIIYTNNQKIFFARNNIKIKGQKNNLISLIPLFSDSHGLTTTNLKYPLKNETLKINSSRGVSNIMTTNETTITLKKGILAIIQTF